MNKKQQIYDAIGREIVNNFKRYKDDIIERHVQEAKDSGIDLQPKKKKKIRHAPTIDMFPELPSRRKEDNGK
jgi:hypothetical protein